MRVEGSVLSANGRPCAIAALAAARCALRGGCVALFAITLATALAREVRAETLPEALVRTYQGNPQLNADRARLRGVNEGVPQALAAYRPQLLATLTGGLQQVRNLFFDNTIQTTTLNTWTIGFTVTQTLFNGFKTANSVRQSEAQVLSGREALRNTGQGVLLDAVTAYTNVIANQSLVEAQRINVTFLRETLATTKKRLEGGGAAEPRAGRSQRRGGRARDQPGALRPSDWRAAGPAGAAGVNRTVAAAHA
jgi:outer membrane protein